MTGPFDMAVLDWGIGGFGFVWAYRARHPSARLLYLSDSGSAPYGLLSRAALRRRIHEVVQWSERMGARRLVIACNAASSALDESVQSLPVSGIVRAGISQVARAGFRRVGVIGGRRTILSRAYATPLRRMGIEVRQRVAQPLSALVEEGALTGARVDEALTRALRGFRSIDALVMGCTHYPALRSGIERRLPGVALIDPARLWWTASPLRTPLAGDAYVVTPPAMVRDLDAALAWPSAVIRARSSSWLLRPSCRRPREATCSGRRQVR